MHLGSLYTALASFLDARANHGLWLLRIDDSDTPRNIAGSDEQIIDALQAYGLNWDGDIAYQSKHQSAYQSVLKQLSLENLSYPCICTRKALAANNSSIYPGFCLNQQPKSESPHSLRIKSKSVEITFDDFLQGQLTDNIAQQHGDFIINRKDQIIAYQLAVVIDDHLQNISHIIRGIDLLDSTPKQIYLQHLLGYATPEYCHIPVIVDKQGVKLSKQTFAQAVSSDNPEETLVWLLKLLRQDPPNNLKNASVAEILSWATDHWQPSQLKKIRAITNKIG